MRRALSLMAILLIAATAGTARDTEYARETLRGLNGVEVMIENLAPDAERDGLHKTTIQTDVELKLRQAGIKVLTDTEGLAAPGAPYLYIRVTTFRHEMHPGVYAFFIEVRLEQDVRLARGPRIVATGTTTWSAPGILGMVGSSNLATIRDDIKDQVDLFINAYLSVNPK